MKKKNIIVIVASVLAVCVAGLLLSLLVDWPVKTDSAAGDIAKSSRFSRATSTERLSNLEELLNSDENYKNGIVAANMVMQTRAAEFNALVDMSNEVAGEIPAFAEVLKDMNEVRPMIENVCTSLMTAVSDLDACLSGESRPDLTQNTINASLAYTTLQKQNTLADRFIETTDRYLAAQEGDDRLKFVRDQWLEYQQMTAALNGDEERAAQLDEKGVLLTSEKSVAALNSFDIAEQLVVLSCTTMAAVMDVETNLSNSLSPEVIDGVFDVISHAAEVSLENVQVMEHSPEVMRNSQDVQGSDAIQDAQASYLGIAGLLPEKVWEVFRHTVTDELSAMSKDVLGRDANIRALENNVDASNIETVVMSFGQTPKFMQHFQDLVVAQTPTLSNQTEAEAGLSEAVLSQTERAMSQTERALNQTERGLNQTERALNQTERALNNTLIKHAVISSSQVGDVIEQTALGNVQVLELI